MSSFMKWEYMTLMVNASTWFDAGVLDGDKFTARLNQLGEEGWEVVSVFDTNGPHGGGTRDVVAILKRPAT